MIVAILTRGSNGPNPTESSVEPVFTVYNTSGVNKSEFTVQVDRAARVPASTSLSNSDHLFASESGTAVL